MAGLLNLAPATCPGTGWPRRGHWPRGPLVLVFAAVAFATGADTQVSAVAVALAALVFGLRTSGS